MSIAGGTVKFDGLFSQSVAFDAAGTLDLSESTRFRATIAGFSAETTLDLRDIGFVNSNEATFTGTVSGGRLIVIDGVHTARIRLSGDYVGATFTASSDGEGGVVVTESGASIQRFAAAAASLTPTLGVTVGGIWRTLALSHAPLLAIPHTPAA